ncbi:MAG: hypothetical protein AAFX00_05265 [Pseudomonadota bacterium]
MPCEQMFRVLTPMGAALGIALWMSIMMQAALALPVVGFAVMIPAALVVYAAWKAVSGHCVRGPDLYI